MSGTSTHYDQTGSSSSGPDMEKLKAKVGEAVEPMKEKAAQAVREQKDAGAGQLHNFAQAVHGAARELEQQMPKVANLIHEAGDQVDRFASNMKDKSLEEMINSVRDFARRQPALVLGGALFAGLLLSRFLKSSPNATYGSQRRSFSSSEDYLGDGEREYVSDTAPSGDYGVAAGRRYDEQASRHH